MKYMRASWAVGKWCAGCVRDLLLCALWLLLAGLMALQVYLLTVRELPMPAWMLRQIESRLAIAGLHAQIATAKLDLAGRVVLGNLQLSQTASSDPFVTVEALNLQLSPLALLHGEVEARYVRGNGVDFLLPAMLSPSGRNEPVISGVCLAFKPESGKLTLDQLTGHIANLTFSCHGTLEFPLNLQTDHAKTAGPASALSRVLREYTAFCQELAKLEPELQSLESPHLDLVFTPASAGSACVAVSLVSTKADFDLSRLKPGAGRVQISGLRASTVLPLAVKKTQAVLLRFSCTQVHGTTNYEAQSLVCDLTGDLAPNFTKIEPTNLIATAESVLVNGFPLENPLIHLKPGTSPFFHAELATSTFGADWQINALADPGAGRGTLTVAGAITPEIVQLVEKRLGLPPGSVLKLSAPAPLSLAAEFDEGWKPRSAHGHVSTGPAVAGSVPITAFQGDFTYGHDELNVTDIRLQQGENLARGSYWMNIKDNDFSFLLTGRLRPIGISGWFDDWWPNFWGNFDFAASIPVADVAVVGQWGKPYLTTVFVHADVARTGVRSIPFDTVRTTMFIRPNFYDALELKVTQGDRSAQGTFTRAVDLSRDEDALRSMDFDVTSNLDLTETAKIFGQEGIETVQPFTFANPPSLELLGHVDGPASARGSHRLVHIGLKSSGAFSLFEFPLENLSFHGIVRDHDIDLNDVQVSFAGGQALGRAYLSGPEAERRLSFDCAIEGANIGDTIDTLEQFFAKQRGEPPSPNSKFQQQISDGRLNLQLAAQGLYSDPLSFNGHGSFELGGAQLARINLLGLLSQLLSKSPLFSFTALQLNNARSSFSLDHQRVDFPDFKITGNSAAIEAKGSFMLDKKLMDFSAKVYPFEQGKTLLASAAGFVLVPFSNALELKLSGTLDQPNWRFAYGPTNILYNITGTKPPEPDPNQPEPDKTRKLPPIYLQR